LAWGEFTPNLPVIFLKITNAISQEVPAPCQVRVVYPAGVKGEPTNEVAGNLRYHGATSMGYPKKSLKLGLENAAPLAGLGKKANWVLNAAYVDRSMMRHKLSYDLFLSLAQPGAPRPAAASRFVEVFVNDKYQGVYLLMERVDRQLLGLRPFQTNDFTHACIYKAVDHAANFGQPGHGGFEQREPDPARGEYWRPLDLFTRFVSTASPEVFNHPQTGIVNRLDLGSAIDFHLLVLLTSNGDGITKNYMIARNGHETGPQRDKFFFVPWDYDGTFGRNWDGQPYPHDVWLSNGLFDRLMQNADYRKRFAARWSQLRQREFSEATILGMIEANARTLGDAMKRNAQRWSGNRGGNSGPSAFEQDLDLMRRWVPARLKWLDQEIAR
jgi:spore coat protein CotH